MGKTHKDILRDLQSQLIEPTQGRSLKLDEDIMMYHEYDRKHGDSMMIESG